MKRVLLFVFCLLLTGATALAVEVKKISKEDLKSMLGSSELVLLDVRTGNDWSSSEYKIKGAVRIEGEEIDAATKRYHKDQTIVLYCA